MKYVPGNIFELVFCDNGDEEGYYRLLFVDDRERKCFYLVNFDTYEVEYKGDIESISDELKSFIKLSDLNVIDTMIDNYLDKRYPTEKYKRRILRMK